MSKKNTFLCLMTSITLTGVILIEIISNYFHKDDEKQNDSFKKCIITCINPSIKVGIALKVLVSSGSQSVTSFGCTSQLYSTDYCSLDSSNHTQLTAGT